MIDRACISISNRCNMRCSYCHFSNKYIDPYDFTVAAIKDILSNIIEYLDMHHIQQFKLGLVGAGEPMLRYDLILSLLDQLRILDESRIAVYTITNGISSDTSLLKQFADYRDIFKICFSLDGPKWLHNLCRGNFDSIMNTIKNYKKVFGHAPHINATASSLLCAHKVDVVNFFLEHGLTQVTFSKLALNEPQELYREPTDIEFRELLGYAQDKKLFLRQVSKNSSYDCTMYGALCGVGRTNIFITPKGVYPCGRFYGMNEYKLGEYYNPLPDIADRCSLLTPPNKGKCFFDENIKKGVYAHTVKVCA